MERVWLTGTGNCMLKSSKSNVSILKYIFEIIDIDNIHQLQYSILSLVFDSHTKNRI